MILFQEKMEIFDLEMNDFLVSEYWGIVSIEVVKSWVGDKVR